MTMYIVSLKNIYVLAHVIYNSLYRLAYKRAYQRVHASGDSDPPTTLRVSQFSRTKQLRQLATLTSSSFGGLH